MNGDDAMSKMKLHAFLMILAALTFADCGYSQTTCPDTASAPAKELIGFLESNGRTADPECVRKVIVQFGEAKDTSAINVLIGLLDFRRPDNEMEKKGFLRMEDRYPAVESLFQIGQRAIPYLISTIGSDKTSALSRQNALRTVAMINREDPSKAIFLLKKASRESKDTSEAVRLEAAAKAFMPYCGARWHDKCAAALEGPN